MKRPRTRNEIINHPAVEQLWLSQSKPQKWSCCLAEGYVFYWGESRVNHLLLREISQELDYVESIPMNNENNTYDDLKKALLLGIFFLALCLA
jgi:hypothetical protein